MNTRYALITLAGIIFALCVFFFRTSRSAKRADEPARISASQQLTPPVAKRIELKADSARKASQGTAGPGPSGLEGVAALNSSSMREFTTRAVVRDYVNFVGGLSLSAAGKDLVYQLLVDQNLSSTDEEAIEYDKLITDAIGAEAYARLQTYREGLRRDALAEGALRYLQQSAEHLAEDMKPSVRAAIAGTNIAKSDIDALFGGNAPSDHALEEFRQRISSAMDQAFLANAAGLTDQQRAAIKRWYITTTVDQRAAFLERRKPQP